MSLDRFDLNLLKTLDAVAHERSVQLAALRLHVTPSAVSHAIARLRRSLDDVLFVRSGNQLVPTLRCREILSQIRPFLSIVDLALYNRPGSSAETFNPEGDKRNVTIVIPGALELTLLPILSERIARCAPGWVLSFRAFQRRSYEADLHSGEADVVLSVGGHTSLNQGISINTLWHDELVAIQGPSGPLSKDQPTSLNEIIRLPQIYAMSWPQSQNYFDIRLAREGERRSIPLFIPSYTGIGETLRRTAHIAVMPDRTAYALLGKESELSLIRIAPAIRTPLSLETTERFLASPAGQWFLSELRDAANELAHLD